MARQGKQCKQVKQGATLGSRLFKRNSFRSELHSYFLKPANRRVCFGCPAIVACMFVYLIACVDRPIYKRLSIFVHLLFTPFYINHQKGSLDW